MVALLGVRPGILLSLQHQVPIPLLFGNFSFTSCQTNALLRRFAPYWSLWVS